MLARKCDRCGALYEPKCHDIRGHRVNGIVLIDRDLNNMTNYMSYIDLCPICLAKLAVWLRAKECECDETNS